MSLSLNDLKKRAVQTNVKSDSSHVSDKRGPARANEARPWTSVGLSQRAPDRKAAGDVAMSAEWANDHTDSWPAFDMEAPSALVQLHDLQIALKVQIAELRRKIKQAAKSPIESARAVFPFIRK